MARILIVEDVRFISRVLASFFADRGHTVDVAADGEQALEMARKHLPELILSDISMPKIDGLEVARRLKSDPKTAIIPIMMVTSRTDPEAMSEAHESGVDAYVRKPFETKALLEKASQLLGGFPVNYSVSLWDTVAVVRILTRELDEGTAGHLPRAIAAARAATTGAVIFDFSRVQKVEPGCVDAMVTGVNALAAVRAVHAVEPRTGMGARMLRGGLEANVQWYPDLESPLRAAGVPANTPERPLRLGAPAPRSTARA